MMADSIVHDRGEGGAKVGAGRSADEKEHHRSDKYGDS